MSTGIPFLVLTGTVGVGKTSVGETMSDMLMGLGIPHAFIDRDALTWSWPRSGRFNDDLALVQLASLWPNYQAVGADRLIMAGVIETEADIQRHREAIDGAEVILCRLTAPQPVREARLRGRDRGESLAWHLARTVELDAILDAASLEHHRFENGDRPVEEVAREILVCVGWLPDNVPADP